MVYGQPSLVVMLYGREGEAERGVHFRARLLGQGARVLSVSGATCGSVQSGWLFARTSFAKARAYSMFEP